MKIYSYLELLKKLSEITEIPGYVKGISSLVESGIEIPYYIYGNGNNHIIVVGGIHGNEIITVNVILNIMEKAYLIDRNKYTIHFIPVLNPEGYIIATSCISKKVNLDDENELKKISYDYYLNYKHDCIYDGKIKLHQEMFCDVDYKCIENKNLQKMVESIYKNNIFPDGSLIDWRSNGYGLDLNRENEFIDLTCNNITFSSDNLRCNNILTNTAGPLGFYRNEVKSSENTFLFNLVCKLYNEKKYAGLLFYHSTGGCIYYEPDKRCKYYNQYLSFNKKLANSYRLKTKYISPNGLIKNGYKLVLNNGFFSTDEYLRIKFPGVILVELSYMGGNPLGPFGDKENNYIPTIENNFVAFMNFINECKKNKEYMYKLS